MTVNGTVDLGSIIAAGSIIVTLIVLHAANVRRITRIETRVDALWDHFMRRQGAAGRSGDQWDVSDRP